METNNIIDLYSQLKKSLFGTDLDVFQSLHYEQNGKHYYLDIVIKRGNAVVSLFEFKEILGKGSIKELYVRQCKIYQSLFPDTKPFMFLTDGKAFYEISEKSQKLDELKFSDIIRKIKVLQPLNIVNESCYNSFMHKWIKSSQYGSNFMDKFISEIKKKCDERGFDEVFESHETYFCFTDKYENRFFKLLLGEEKKDIYRYIPLDVLQKTLTEKRQAFASIICMNDETECYYSQNYVDKKMIGDFMTIDKMEAYTQGSKCFIMSCTTNSKESMEMWDEYGDKAQGVRVCFKICDNSSFIIAPVSYSKESGDHPSLNLIANILKEKYDGVHFIFSKWESWQHFFKPHKYKKEQEVRALYYISEKESRTMDIKWVYKKDLIFPLLYFDNQETSDFPFPLKEIRFGPFVGNMDQNIVVTKQMLSVNNIKISGDDVDYVVLKSKYRR